MKAILFAAGKGTRLGKITSNFPKCLIEVAGVAIIDHWIYKLSALGVTNFLINTHYMAAMVEAHLNVHPLKDKFTIVREDKLFGTAGTLQRNLKFCDAETFLVHVDNYCQDDLSDFLALHRFRPQGTILSMLTFETEMPEQCGIVKIDKYGVMQSFAEKPTYPKGKLANGAVFLGDGEFFNFLKDLPIKIDLSKEIIPLLTGKVYCIKTDKFFIDIGTEDNLSTARKFAATAYAK